MTQHLSHSLRTLFTALLVGGLTGCNGELPDVDAGASNTDAGTTSQADGGSVDPDIDAGVIDGGIDAGMVDTGPADFNARFIVTNQRVFREDDFFARGGIAVFEIYNPQDLPADERTEFFNADGERCTVESGSEWPTVLADGTTWPSAPFLNAGLLSLTADNAPGDVVYGYFDSYYLRAQPGPVEFDNITHNSFFPPEYIPHGAGVTFSAPGDSDVAGFEMSGLQLASDYTVGAPNLVEGGDLIDTTQALSFSWTPGDDKSRMAVIVKSGFSFIKCIFDDDGDSVVPADAMAMLPGGQFVQYTIQTWREQTEERRVLTDDGAILDVVFTSRHTQIGRFSAP